MFQIGENVVHPKYGVGRIVKLDDREFDHGASRRYYEIHVPGGSTIWVPVDLSTSGLRKLASKGELARCREILKALPLPLTEDGRVRQADLAVRLQKGTILAQCEVVRDVSAFVAHKSSYGTISAFLEALLNVLCQEWAMVEGVTIHEARSEVSSLLRKDK